MEQNINKRNNAKDFFLNLGATISLYTVVYSLLNLLFTVIDTKYPKITNAYQYMGTSTISWPVAMLIIFVPILLVLMSVISKSYEGDEERKNTGIHKWLTYLTLFLAGLILAGDLVTVLYYFIDGQELTTAFLLKGLSVLVVSGSVFTYFLNDIRNKLTKEQRMFWRVFAIVLVSASILWGFSVLGSPRTQRLVKYDEQKVYDLQNIKGMVEQYYMTKGSMPESLAQLSELNYMPVPVDMQSGNQYTYELIGQSAKAYKLCAVFNFDTTQSTKKSFPYGTVWTHGAGNVCFNQSIPVNMYVSPKQLN